MDYTVGDAQTGHPVYDLLRERQASSLGFACVVNAECAQAQIACELVEGTRGGAYHAWNRLTVNGEECYIDLMRALERGNAELELLTAQTLAGESYVWQTPEETTDS